MSEAQAAWPALGRHEGVPMPDYHASPHLGSSAFGALSQSPAAFRWQQDHPQPSNRTKALRLGSAAHTAILEPDAFESTYSLDPEPSDEWLAEKIAKIEAKGGDVATAAKGWRNTDHYRGERWKVEGKGKEIITQDEWDKAQRIRDNLWNVPSEARDVVSMMTASEVSYAVTDPVTGLGLQCRFDLEAEWSRIFADVKTARDASAWAFGKQAYDLGYYRSHAFYRYVHKLWCGEDDISEYLYLVIETEPPFETAVFRLDEPAMQLGADSVNHLLGVLAECNRTGEWPGRSNTVQPLSLPTYAYFNVNNYIYR